MGYNEKEEVSTCTLINKYGFSSTINRLRHNQRAPTQLIDDLCRILECKVEGVIVYVKGDDFEE